MREKYTERGIPVHLVCLGSKCWWDSQYKQNISFYYLDYSLLFVGFLWQLKK